MVFLWAVWHRYEGNSSLSPYRVFSFCPGLSHRAHSHSMANLCWVPGVSHHHSSPGELESAAVVCVTGGRKRGRSEGDETFMRQRYGVGSHNENAEIELFSRTKGGVMRVKTAWRCVCVGGGGQVRSRGELRGHTAPLCEKTANHISRKVGAVFLTLKN